jgi:hypothetical protein
LEGKTINLNLMAYERVYLQLHAFLTSVLWRLRWAGHVARMGERRGAYRALVGKPERRNHLEDPGVDGRIILKWIFERGVGA